MPTETVEERLAILEAEVARLKAQAAPKIQEVRNSQRGWRWFVGIFADDPTFDEAVRAGQEWRSADRPTDEGALLPR